MATNFVETIQKNLGLPALQKIDPNSQEMKEKSLHSSQEKLAQAAIPAVLAAMYKYTRMEEGCQEIISTNENPDWLSTFFEGREQPAIDKVAMYSDVTTADADQLMHSVADESVRTLKSSIKPKLTVEGIRTFMDNQRHNVLVYLPAAMKMGDILNDEALDDRTNKMEGPVSGFMHRVENMLSKGDEPKYP